MQTQLRKHCVLIANFPKTMPDPNNPDNNCRACTNTYFIDMSDLSHNQRQYISLYPLIEHSHRLSDKDSSEYNYTACEGKFGYNNLPLSFSPHYKLGKILVTSGAFEHKSLITCLIESKKQLYIVIFHFVTPFYQVAYLRNSFDGSF
ncbi:uncharacterized protein EV154DRAFT_554054 [Mucor mucedo]|uniref:uncharacterized protein n=1 Tax=Mucor mucedo TaxID=29922 RepID=UPI0022211808|nr:uncharacterized protein EV154DRAFT_554054 [Mucor mucedo]KAI7888157.1 hypothetical protein EV154DRAFT_554054 [Mucor mucedo]